MTYTVRIGIMQGFSELVQEFAGDPGILLRRCHIDPALLENDDSRVALNSLLRLLELAAEETHCEHFGLLLASKQKTSFLGLMELLLESSVDLENAINKAIRYFRIHAQGVEWRLCETGEFASLRYTVDAPPGINTRQDVDLAVCQCFQALRSLSNNRWRPLQVCFHSEKSKDDWYYKHLFGVPTIFNSEFDGIVFKRSDLKLPMSRTDERVHKVLSQYAELLDRDSREDLCSQIKSAIRKLLPEGRCSIQTLANLMACDKRTLQRNLKQEGASYQQLLDEVRYAMAQEYLRESAMPLTNLATMLGYTEVSAFSRAFKKQFGLAPSAWRKQYR